MDETALDPSRLVPVADYAPTVYVDLKYAGTDNFMGQAVYDFHEPMLRRGTALRLARAQELLLAQGYSLKIWDAWRPLSAQFKMWQVCPNDDYVADPTHGGSSKHNRGSAVDVTLVTAAGEALLMPTAFDDFAANPNRDYDKYGPQAAAHARILEAAMVAAGFVPYDNEWWHFNDRDPYPVAERPASAAPELWDGVDREGNPLGVDLVRGAAIPEGVYHQVVMVLTVTDRGNVLITQRHPDKPFGLLWEITGGSVLKGEPPLEGAVRELEEEVGIRARPSGLSPILTHAWEGSSALYHFYGLRVQEDGLSVTLQAGETVDWKLIPYPRFKELLRQEADPVFPAPFRRRFLEYEPLFDQFILT